MGITDMVGIDLGTSTCEACIWKGGRITNVPLTSEQYTLPSCVYYENESISVGKPAVIKGDRNPKRFISHAKRLMGIKYSNNVVERDRNSWNVNLIKNESGAVDFEIKDGDIYKVVSPIDVSATLLKDIHNKVNRFAGITITKAVISVPATFNNDQRAATITAARIAGFEDVRIVTEPTAASIAYAYQQEINMEGNLNGTIMVYDLGGGTFDVSILQVEGRNYTILTNQGDSHLGGEDFDQAILNFVMKQAKEVHNTRFTPRSKAALLGKVREAKHCFTRDCQEVYVDIDEEHSIVITPSLLTDLINHFIHTSLNLIQKALDELKLNISDIKAIVLVGGSSRLYIVEDSIRNMYPGVIIAQNIHSELAVSEGALLMGMATSTESPMPIPFRVTDCTSFPIFLQTSRERGVEIIPKSTTLPYIYSRTYVVRTPGSRMRVALYQGNYEELVKDELIGHFYINGIRELIEKYQCLSFVLTVRIDAGGLITIEADCVEDPEVAQKLDVKLESKVEKDETIKKKKAKLDDYVKKNVMNDLRLRIRDLISSLEIRFNQNPSKANPNIVDTVEYSKELLLDSQMTEEALKNTVEELEKCLLLA